MKFCAYDKLFVTSYDYLGRAWALSDARQVVIGNKENGYWEAHFVLDRDYDDDYSDIDYNFMLRITNARDDTAWQGRVDGIKRLQEKAARKHKHRKVAHQGIEITAIGYWGTLSDTSMSGQPIPTQVSPEANIAWIWANPDQQGRAYMPHIASVNCAVSGWNNGNGIYSYHVNSPTERKISDVINDQCAIGTYGPPNLKIIPQVWNDRVLSTKILPDPAVARYVVRRPDTGDIGLERRLSDTANRVILWYLVTGGGGGVVPTREERVDTTTLNALTITYPGTNTPVPFYKNATLDITSTQGSTPTLTISGSVIITTQSVTVSPAQARQEADSYLAFQKNPKASGPIEIARACSVFDVVTNQFVPIYLVRSGEWIDIPDLLPRGNTSISGTPGNSLTSSTLYYISQVEYNDETQVATITGEKSNKIADLVQLL